MQELGFLSSGHVEQTCISRHITRVVRTIKCLGQVGPSYTSFFAILVRGAKHSSLKKLCRTQGHCYLFRISEHAGRLGWQVNFW